MDYFPIIVIIFLVLGWGEILQGIYYIFKPIKDGKGKTITWKNGKETVQKEHDEVVIFPKNNPKLDLEYLSKNKKYFRHGLKMEFDKEQEKKKNNENLESFRKEKDEEEQEKKKLNEKLESFRKIKNEEEQKIKDERTKLEYLINYVRCNQDRYPNYDDTIKDIVCTFRKIFIEGIEKRQDKYDTVNEIEDFYKYIKKDVTIKHDDMDRLRNIIHGLHRLFPMKQSPSKPKKVRRPSISQNVKDKVWKRDDGKCVQCGSNENIEFDHIIPFSKGGSSTYRNLQILCEKCNRSKSDKIG